MTRLLAGRRSAPQASDLVFGVYLALLLTLVFAGPLIGMSLSGVEAPQLEVLRTIADDRAAVHVGAAAALVGALWAGMIRGPALIPVFVLRVLLSTDIPRRAHLIPRAARTIGVVWLSLGAVLVGVEMLLVHPGGGDPSATAVRVVALAGFAGCLMLAWGCGQVMGATARQLVTAFLGTAALAAFAEPAGDWASPAGWFSRALTEPDESGGLMSTVLVIAVVVLLPALAPLLDRLPAAVLIGQASRVSAAMLFSSVGQLGDVAEPWRPAPRGFRARGRRAPGSLARLAVVELLRRPGPLIWGAAGIILGTTALTLLQSGGVELRPGARAALVGVVAAVLVQASGPFSRSWRRLGDQMEGPPLFGSSPRRRLLSGSFAPILIIGLCGALGGMSATMIVGTGAAAPTSWAVVATLLVVLGGRLVLALKGEMPLALTVPVPTAAGDLSGLAMVAWHLDGHLIAGVVCGGMVLVDPDPLTALGGGAATAAACLLLAWSRSGLGVADLLSPRRRSPRAHRVAADDDA